MKVGEKLKNLQAQIVEVCEKVDRDPSEITIVAVTKYVSNERAQEVVAAGIKHLGENRDDGFLAKHKVLGDEPVWHFIGTLQSRKVKNVIHKIDYLHSLERLSLAKEIEKRSEKKLKCFVQVNVSGEQSKHGLEPEQVKDFIIQLRDFEKIEVVGLMTMAPYTDQEDIVRNCFRTLKDLQTKIQDLQLEHAPCKELSMGMSGDFAIAIEEGATMIRVGTALVGEDN